jgi:hypothetical protein
VVTVLVLVRVLAAAAVALAQSAQIHPALTRAALAVTD